MKNSKFEIVPTYSWYEALPPKRNFFKLFLCLFLLSLIVTILRTKVDSYEYETVPFVESEFTPSPGKIEKVSHKVLSEKVKLTISKNGVEQLTPKTIKSEWDKFRYNVYQIAGDIKNEFPNIGASQIQIYDWSMKLMFHESRFDPNAHNSIDAQGLFQAIPSTRKWLKCGTLKGRHWSYQLRAYREYVSKSLKSLNVSQINDFGDWYYIGLYPAHADKPDWVVFGKRGAWNRLGSNYRCNKGLDANKDGIITKGEVYALVLKRCTKS